MSITINLSNPPEINLDLSAEAPEISVTPQAGPEITVEFPGVAVAVDAMAKTVYDPTEVAADVFDLANHTGSMTAAAVLVDGGLL